MMKFVLAAVLFLFPQVEIAAQMLPHPLGAEGNDYSPAVAKTYPDTARVLAVMVEFKTDVTPLTSGNGHFDTTTIPQRIIDAPPRDSAYFADHLLFAKNYFFKTSNGKQNIEGTVLGKVILPDSMERYSSLSTALPLAALVEDSWKAADSLYPAFPFERYDLFIIFHAGSGKDIDLRAALGYDPTPYDLPSIYFNLSGLKKLLGSSYTGVSLKNHPGFRITNSALLPETENRRLPSVGGDYLFQLGLNGLLVSSIASHLGLPDLFDTRTGRTAIGRFGLMDGQSIFSFSGLFPPEPSAWEKQFLGWTKPIVVPPGTASLRVPAVGLFSTGEDTVYRIPISAKEYFLVENRNRDLHTAGQTLTIRWNKGQFQKTFLQDDSHFNAFSVDSVYGTVIDVEDLDWSLPGAVGYNGGILIWHVDETVIEKNLTTNSVNADPDRRGVDLEEADGSQDLGQSYGFLSAGSGSEDGTPLDFWFLGNNAPIYRNEFSETSFPSSLSNSMAHSHVAITQFSAPGAVMTMKSIVGDPNVALVRTIKRADIRLDNNDAPMVVNAFNDAQRQLIFSAGSSVYAVREDYTPLLPTNTTGLFLLPSTGKTFQPTFVSAFDDSPRSNYLARSQQDSVIFVYAFTDSGNTGSAAVRYVYSHSHSITTPIAAPYLPDMQRRRLYFGDAKGFITTVFDSAGSVRSRMVRAGWSLVVSLSVLPDRRFVAASEDSIFTETGMARSFNGRKEKSLVTIRSITGTGVRTQAVVTFTDNSVSVLDAATLEWVRHWNVPGAIAGPAAVADVDNDGQPDILIGTDAGLYAYNMNGVQLEYFPLSVLDGGNIVGSPFVAKQVGSNENIILFGSAQGHIYAYAGRRTLLKGFPVPTGGSFSTPVLFGDKLVASSSDSSVYFWKVESLLDTSRVEWGNFLADIYHTNHIEFTGPVISRTSELLPQRLAYNWPNPVYDNTTKIRYFLGKPAAVKIRIFTMTGDLVDELNGTGFGNLDNEVEWNVSRVQSGVYFATIHAVAGAEETNAIIKIAVVK